MIRPQKYLQISYSFRLEMETKFLILIEASMRILPMPSTTASIRIGPREANETKRDPDDLYLGFSYNQWFLIVKDFLQSCRCRCCEVHCRCYC